MRGVVTELRATLATVLAAAGDRGAAEQLLALARTEMPRSDVRARRHVESAERRIREGAAPPLPA